MLAVQGRDIYAPVVSENRLLVDTLHPLAGLNGLVRICLGVGVIGLQVGNDLLGPVAAGNHIKQIQRVLFKEVLRRLVADLLLLEPDCTQRMI